MFPCSPRFVVVLISWSFCLGAGSLHAAESHDDTACFLAGIKPSEPDPGEWFETAAWKSHEQQLSKKWEAYEENTLKKMDAWAAKEVVPHVEKGGLVRYMFSGPDILHAVRMFPESDRFILCGLEPVGAVPDIGSLSAGEVSTGLSQIRTALGEILAFSFFRTNDMKDDLRQDVFPGTIPVMFLFLAASGQEVLEVEYLDLDAEGKVSTVDEAGSDVEGVKIVFADRANPTDRKSVSYFSINVADWEIEKNGFLSYLESQPKGAAYVKAASYLMHKQYFSKIRSHLLSHSKVVVQDDSGIPFRFFDSADWDISLFGAYDAPIDLFSEWQQSELRTAYRTESFPLDFGTGYNWRKGRSNLMRMVRQDEPAEE